MLKTLVVKQIKEIFNFNQNAKDKSKINKNSRNVTIAIWSIAMLIVMVAMFFMALGMGGGLIGNGHIGLFYAVFAIISIFLGTFGSVFNSYHALYLAKDNEMLLSMPIEPKKILLARMISVFLLSFIYSAIVWLPSVAVGIIELAKINMLNAFQVIYPLFLTVVISLLVNVLTCAIGFIIAVCSTKFKKNRFITILFYLALIFGLYMLQFNMTNIMQGIVRNAVEVETIMSSWLAPIYHMGLAAAGSHLSFLLFTSIVAILFAITYYVLSISFIKLATTRISDKKKKYKKEKLQKGSVLGALLKKEFKKFYSLTIYFLNAGFGLFIVIIVCIVALIKMGTISDLILELSTQINGVHNMVIVIIPAFLSMVLEMNSITAPTISLEAKTIWMLKSLPIKTKDILNAKVLVAIIYNSIGVLIGTIMLSIAFKINILAAIIGMIPSVLFITIIAQIGLLLNLKMPSFNWTNEVVPIKQGAPVAITLFGGMLLGPAIYLPYFFISAKLHPIVYLLVLSALLVAIEETLRYFINKKGVEMFEAL